jgi:Mn2+/Fe2+ NRAMP family transporter
VINGVAAGPFLALLMLISSDRKIMGDYRNGKIALILGWLTTALMTAAAIVLFAFGHGGGLY